MPKNGQGPDQGRVKFRVIEFEVEGANATLIESIKNLGAAISRGNSAQPIKTIRPATGNGAAVLSAGATDAEESDDSETIEHEVSAATPSRPRAKRTINSPEILNVDFTSGTVPLKDFVEGKSPDSDAKRYAVIAYWFKHYGATPNVTADHIHTGYRFLGWNTPKDAAQPLRDLKSKNQWLSKGEARGEYTINHVGENVVANQMPNG
jgi:hypothetical protein